MTFNKCAWLLIDKPTCNKNCKGRYCSYHNWKSSITLPPSVCLKCGINGTKGVSGICRPCGGEVANRKIYAVNWNITRRARYRHKRLLKELLNKVEVK